MMELLIFTAVEIWWILIFTAPKNLSKIYPPNMSKKCNGNLYRRVFRLVTNSVTCSPR